MASKTAGGGSKQRSLGEAKAAKDDEFYTQLSDIEKELRHYKKHFKGKVVYLTFDDGPWPTSTSEILQILQDNGAKATFFEKVLGLAHGIRLARDVAVVAVNGEAYSAKRLARAIAAAKSQSHPIELLVRQGERYRTARIDYRDGLRAPHLERIAGKPDFLTDILSARK